MSNTSPPPLASNTAESIFLPPRKYKPLNLTYLFKKEKTFHVVEKTRVKRYIFQNITEEASYLLRKPFFIKTKQLKYLKSLNIDIYQLFFRFKGKPKNLNFTSNRIETLRITNIPQTFSPKNKGILLVNKILRRFKNLKTFLFDHEISYFKSLPQGLFKILSPIYYLNNLLIFRMHPLQAKDIHESLLHFENKVLNYLKHHRKLLYTKVPLQTQTDSKDLKKLSVLSKKLPNLKALEIASPLDNLLPKIIYIFSLQLQSLQHLLLRLYQHQSADPTFIHEVLKSISQIKPLKSLHLEAFPETVEIFEGEDFENILSPLENLEFVEISVVSPIGCYGKFWDLLKGTPKLRNLKITVHFANKQKKSAETLAKVLSAASFNDLRDFSLELLPIKKYSLEYSLTPTILNLVLPSYEWLGKLKHLTLEIAYCAKEGETSNSMVSRFLNCAKNLESLELNVGENFLTNMELSNIAETIGLMPNLAELTFSGNFCVIVEKTIEQFITALTQIKYLNKLILNIDSMREKYARLVKEPIMIKYKTHRCHLHLHLARNSIRYQNLI